MLQTTLTRTHARTHAHTHTHTHAHTDAHTHKPTVYNHMSSKHHIHWTSNYLKAHVRNNTHIVSHIHPQAVATRSFSHVSIHGKEALDEAKQHSNAMKHSEAGTICTYTTN